MDYQLIKTLAKEKNISIESLAESIGMSRTGLNATLKNGTLKVEALEKIANVLGVSPTVFFSGQNFDSLRDLISKDVQINLHQYMSRMILEQTDAPDYIFKLLQSIPAKTRKGNIDKSNSFSDKELESLFNAGHIDVMEVLLLAVNILTDPVHGYDMDLYKKNIGFVWREFLGILRGADELGFLFEEELYDDVDFIEDARAAFHYCFKLMPDDWHQQLKDTLPHIKKKK